MIDVLKSLFFAGSGGPRDEVQTEVAVAALLVDAARADGDYAPSERAAVDVFLQRMFALGPDEARALRARGEEAQACAPDIVRFTRVIKMGLSEDERVGVMQGLWQIVLADDHRDPEENALMRHLAPLLAVSDHDSARARQRAMAGRAD